MQQTMTCFGFGILMLVLFHPMSSTGSVISCPPSTVQQELNPKISQLCYAIEQALQDNSPQNNDGYTGRLVDERNTAKRQDVDHVFLRFGRRYGL